MASLRKRKRKTGTYWLVVDRLGHERTAGEGKAGEKRAKRWAARLEQAEWAERVGEPVETVLGALWTLEELKAKDLKAAEDRRAASLPSRRRRWAKLIGFFGDVQLDRITPAEIRAYAAGGKAKPQTVNNDLSILSAALKLARSRPQESGYRANPFADVERLPAKDKRPSVALPQKRVDVLLGLAREKAAAAPPQVAAAWADNALILELAYETSSRISQILSLRRDQLSGRFLAFPSQKGGKPKVSTLPTRLALAIRRRPDGYLFRGRGQNAHREGLRRFWAAICREVGVSLRIHDLRHSSATNAIRAGESIDMVAARLGHQTITMVQRIYGHVYPGVLPSLPRAGKKTAGPKRRSNAGSGRATKSKASNQTPTKPNTGLQVE